MTKEIFHFQVEIGYSFFNLKDKCSDDYDIAMKYLVEHYSFSKVDYRMFRPNLLRNHDYIELHQKFIVILQFINLL